MIEKVLMSVIINIISFVSVSYVAEMLSYHVKDEVLFIIMLLVLLLFIALIVLVYKVKPLKNFTQKIVYVIISIAGIMFTINFWFVGRLSL